MTDEVNITAVPSPPKSASSATPAAAPTTALTQVSTRLAAFMGDMHKRAGTRLDAALWKNFGYTEKVSAELPTATSIRYAATGAARALFEGVAVYHDKKKRREGTGIWLTKNADGTDAGAPCPLLPSSAAQAIADPSLPLYVTDREDVAVALAFSQAAAICVAPGASLFQNEDRVDDMTPEQARTLHPACQKLHLGERALICVMYNRAEATHLARSLRRGDAHTGPSYYAETGRVLASLDSAIAQGLTGDALHERTRMIPYDELEEITAVVHKGAPGSVGMRVPSRLLTKLPSSIRDLVWPVTPGGGASYDNLDWDVQGNLGDTVFGVYREQRGDDMATVKSIPVLRTPVYITTIFEDDLGNTQYELTWQEGAGNAARAVQRIFPVARFASYNALGLAEKGVPVIMGRYTGQWFQAFLVANPDLPRRRIHNSACWVEEGGKQHFLLPGSGLTANILNPEILKGLGRKGARETHWELTRDFYNACQPINQLLLTAAHASLLLGPLKAPGCLFGLFDDSSKGKTVFLQTSARQYGWGHGDYAFDTSIPPTNAYVERVVQRLNGLCVFIDEFHRLPNTTDRGVLSREQVTYFLTNGERRGRSNAEGGIDATDERVYCYSLAAGEADSITAQNRAEQMEGARVRTITLPLAGYSESFLAKYDGLAGFMFRMSQVQGHVGYDVADALGAELTEHGIEALQDALNELTKKIEALYSKEERVNGVAHRRGRMLAPIALTEQILARRFPDSGMWKEAFEEGALYHALTGTHRACLMSIKVDYDPQGSEVTINDILLSALVLEHQNETRPLNTPPIGAAFNSRYSDVRGIRLDPDRVNMLLRQRGYTNQTARQLMLDSKLFLLQERKGAKPTLYYMLHGRRWYVPVPGWGWRAIQASPGDAEAIQRDAYYVPRTHFEEAFEASLKGAKTTRQALTLATERFTRALGTHGWGWPGLVQALNQGSLCAWEALVQPLVDRLLDKETADTVAELLRWQEWLLADAGVTK